MVVLRHAKNPKFWSGGHGESAASLPPSPRHGGHVHHYHLFKNLTGVFELKSIREKIFGTSGKYTDSQ